MSSNSSPLTSEDKTDEHSLSNGNNQRHFELLPSTPCQKLRYLSLSELTMKNLMDNGVLTVGGLCQFTSTVSLTFEDTINCVNVLCDKYTQLRVNTVYEQHTKKFYWAKLPADSVRSLHNLGEVRESEVMDLFNAEVKKGVKDGGPIWRFYFASLTPTTCSEDDTPVSIKREKYCMFVVCSHALVDGIGMKTMIQDLSTLICQNIERRKRNIHETTTESQEKFELCPPYEDLVPNALIYKLAAFPPCLVADVAVRLMMKFDYLPFRHPEIFNSKHLKPNTVERPLQTQLKTVCVKFSQLEWSNFQKFRRQNGLTVTGLGLSLFGVALMKFAHGGVKWPRSFLGAHVLRDPRLYFKRDEIPPGALVGNYIAAGLLLVIPFLRRQHKQSLSKVVVDTARFITDEIRSNVRNFAAFFNGELQSKLSKNRKLVGRLTEALANHPKALGRFAMIQFSNVGEINCLDPELCGDFNAMQVEKCIGVADQSKCGDCFCSILTTVQGQLFWSIGYPAHMFSSETIESFGDELKSVWNEVVQPAPDQNT